MSSYKVFVTPQNPGWLATQQLFDVASSPAVAPSSTQTFTVKTASCMTQVDAWYGQAPATLLDSNPYGYPNVPFVLTATFTHSGDLCSATTTPSADLSVTKTVDDASPRKGDAIHYTVTVSALGPATSTGVVATDTLPAGLTFVNATASKGTYATSGAWTIGSMSASSSATLQIAALVNASSGTQIANIASATETASSTDPNLGNNSSTVTITVATPSSTIPSADLSLTKTADVTSTVEGGTVHYTLTVTDIGPATSTGVVATDTWPTGLTFVNATASQGSYASSTGTWTIGSMSASSSATLQIAGTVKTGTASTTLTNSAVVGESASSTDPNPGNNTATVPVTIAPNICTVNCGGTATTTADLAITKTVDSANPAGGDTVTYTVTVTDLGPGTSTIVKVSDLLPAGLSLNSATTSQALNPYNMSTGEWDVGTLDPNATATLVISATVDPREAGQPIVNTATVSELSSLPDNSANNSASVTINVQASSTPGGCTGNCGIVTIGGGGGGGSTGGGGGSAYELTIDNGATSTATTSATLSIYATEAYTMEISNDPNFASSTWIPYATEMPWTLLSGAGEKTVYGRFRSIQNTDLGAAQDSIELLGGQVLGAATSCGTYLNDYIRLGWANKPSEVTKLQSFLNWNLGINLPLTGVYGQEDFNAVQQFQLKYNSQVLAPWVPLGLPNQMTSTGFVYQTTRWWINRLECEALNLPIPVLHVYQP